MKKSADISDCCFQPVAVVDVIVEPLSKVGNHNTSATPRNYSGPGSKPCFVPPQKFADNWAIAFAGSSTNKATYN